MSAAIDPFVFDDDDDDVVVVVSDEDEDVKEPAEVPSKLTSRFGEKRQVKRSNRTTSEDDEDDEDELFDPLLAVAGVPQAVPTFPLFDKSKKNSHRRSSTTPLTKRRLVVIHQHSNDNDDDDDDDDDNDDLFGAVKETPASGRSRWRSKQTPQSKSSPPLLSKPSDNTVFSPPPSFGSMLKHTKLPPTKLKEAVDEFTKQKQYFDDIDAEVLEENDEHASSPVAPSTPI